MKKTSLLALAAVTWLVGCAEREIVSFGQTNDGRSFEAETLKSGMVIAGYRIDLSDGTTCNIPIKVSEWRSGQRKFDITCSDGADGTSYVSMTIPYSGPAEVKINFQLDGGVRGDGVIRA